MNEVLSRDPKNVMEVGVGNGFLKSYLEKRGIEVTGVDNNKDFDPDVVGDVRELPLEDSLSAGHRWASPRSVVADERANTTDALTVLH